MRETKSREVIKIWKRTIFSWFVANLLFRRSPQFLRWFVLLFPPFYRSFIFSKRRNTRALKKTFFLPRESAQHRKIAPSHLSFSPLLVCRIEFTLFLFLLHWLIEVNKKKTSWCEVSFLFPSLILWYHLSEAKEEIETAFLSHLLFLHVTLFLFGRSRRELRDRDRFSVVPRAWVVVLYD